MRLLSSPVVGCAADIAKGPFNAGELQTVFMKAGLDGFQPQDWHGKSALVSETVVAAKRRADGGDQAARDGLNEFVELVAERVAPRYAEDEVKAGSSFWKLREVARSDGFDLRAEFASDETAQLTGVRLLPLDEPKIPLSEEITALEADFVRLGMTVALNHYRQAVASFVDQNFEAANGQLRSMLESLIVHFAVARGFTSTKQGEGGKAIRYLRDNGDLPDRDGGDFVRGLWWIVQTNGPHPGTTTAGEVHFRMLTMTGAARYLIDRCGPATTP